MPPIGWFGEDVADAVGKAVSDAWDVVDDLPILREFGGATKAVFTGPLRDFARTSVGQIVLRAMATGAGQFVGLWGGPWAMMMAHALPGVARGDAFEEALLVENLWRLEKAAEIVGPQVSEALAGQYGQAAEELRKRAREALPDLEVPAALSELAARAGVDPETYARRLAAELGIREDMAVQAFELLGRVKLLSQEAYDVATGRKRAAFRARSDTATMAQRSAAVDLLRPRVTLPLATQATVQTRSAALRVLLGEKTPGQAPPLLERSAGAQVSTTRERSRLGWDLALAGLVVGAAATVYWWHQGEKRAGR